MLVPLISGATAVIASSMGLVDFLNSDYAGEESSNLSLAKSLLITISIAAVVIVGAKVVVKLIYDTKETEKELSSVRKGKKKKLKSKIKQNKVSKSEEIKKLESFAVHENQNEQKENELNFVSRDMDIDELNLKSSNIDVHELDLRSNDVNTQEVVDDTAFISSDGWINVEKKVRKKNRHAGSEVRRVGNFNSDNVRVSDISSNITEKASVVTEYSTSEENEIESKYLSEGAKPKNISSRVPLLSEVVRNGKNSTIRSRNVVEEKVGTLEHRNLELKYLKRSEELVSFPSYEGFSRKPDISSNKCYSSLVQHRYVASGLRFQYVQRKNKGHDDDRYRQVVVQFCHKIKKFKRLHSYYCIRMLKQVFRVSDGRVIVSGKVKEFFSKYTSNLDLLLFIIKVSLLVNFATLYGGKKMTNDIRNCVKYFYDQSLLDDVILSIMKVVDCEDNIEQMIRVFYSYANNLSDVSIYEAYSGDFFREVFDLCTDLALVKEFERYAELVEFAMLGCMLYCGHMVSILSRMLIYQDKVDITKDLIVNNFNAPIFCQQCYSFKKIMVHIYHPSEGEITRNIAGKIDVPLVIWKMCSRKIHDTVKNVCREGKLSFGVFVNDMIYPSRRMIVNPSTRYLYMKDVEMYDSKLKKANSLLPLCRRTFLQ